MENKTNFIKDGQVTTPSWEIIKLSALNKREDLLLAVEFYFEGKYNGWRGTELPYLRIRLINLYYELKAWMERVDKEKADFVKISIHSNNFDNLFEAIDYVLYFMDSQNLTKIDNKRVYDKTRVDVEDVVRGI